jgi:signal transduction histidine kinase
VISSNQTNSATQLQATCLEASSLDKQLQLELIKFHIKVIIKMPSALLFAVFTIGLLVYDRVPSQALFAWGIITMLTEFFRVAFARKIYKFPGVINPQPIILRLTLLSVISGASIGLGIAAFLPKLSVIDQSLLCITAFIIPIAYAPATVITILAGYSLMILAPTACGWSILHPEQSLPIVLLTTLYFLFTLSLSADRMKLFRRSLIMLSEHDRIVNDLEQRNADVLKAIEKAEQSAQARSRVLAAASHDLRQPLHALSVYSAVLLSNPEPDTLSEVAGNIDRLVRVLGGLLHGLLDLSRLSSDYYVPERQRISLDRLAAEVCNEFDSNARDKQIKLVRNLGHVRLFDDKVGIARIIRNLLDNALKYTEQGEVRVETYQNGDTATLIIADTGKGIPIDEQNRIFEEFYQLDNPGRDLGKGIGLGLTIVQRLCELIGAEISLVSEHGAGSKFQLIFHSVLHESADRPPPQEVGNVCLRNKRIYVVDDEIDILNSTRSLLKAWHVQVETAQKVTLTEGLFKRLGAPDLLIIDLRLGDEEHGAELASRLQEVYGKFPVLVVTGETASAALQQTNAKAYPILQKPISADVFYDAVCLALQPEV